MKTKDFESFLSSHAEYHYKAGIRDCMESIANSLEEATSQRDKAKLAMNVAAKECGIETK